MARTDECTIVPLDEVLRRRYADSGDRVAVADPRRRLSYTELGARTRRFASGLRTLGLRSGDRMMIIGANSCEWVEAEHACYAGSVVRVSVLPRLHPKEVAQIANEAEPSAVVADASWLRDAGTDWIPATASIRVAMGGDHGQWHAFEEVIEAGQDQDLPAGDPDAARWIGFTSGSMGRAKGVVFTNRTLGAMIHSVVEEIPTLDPTAIALHSAPVSHFSGGIANAVFAAGGTNHLMPYFDVDRLLDAIESTRANVVPLVPTQITMLLEGIATCDEHGAPPDTSSVHTIVYAGSAIAPDRVAAAQERLGHVMLQLYGSSEAPFPVTALHPDEHSDDIAEGSHLPRLASAGRASRHSEVNVVSDEGDPRRPGEVGEIVVRSPQVTPGYWRDPSATAELFGPDGWCHTGDAGYFDAEGFLYLVDRKKDMIITGGFNVYPREVENVISAIPGVREVAVLGVPSTRWGEHVTAFVARTSDVTVSAEDIIRRCRANLAGFKLPKEVRFLDELPKNGAGKILKRVLKDQIWSGSQRRV